MEEMIVRDTREIVRDEMKIRGRIVSFLRDGPKTIPQIAEALERPSHEVVYWVKAMCRYGTLTPTGKPGADGYYQYQILQQDPESMGHLG